MSSYIYIRYHMVALAMHSSNLMQTKVELPYFRVLRMLKPFSKLQATTRWVVFGGGVCMCLCLRHMSFLLSWP